MSVDAERAVRQLQRLLKLDLEGNHAGPPEDFAASTKDDKLIATVVFRPDEGTVTVIDNRKDQPLQ